MRKVPLAVIAFIIVIAFAGRQVAELNAQAKPASKPLQLKVGDPAPEFTLLAFDGKDIKKVSLQDYRGKKNVALAFYVFAFTGG